MSADIFKRKRAHANQLKWTFLALKWAVFFLKLCPIFPRKQTLQIAIKPEHNVAARILFKFLQLSDAILC